MSSDSTVLHRNWRSLFCLRSFVQCVQQCVCQSLMSFVKQVQPVVRAVHQAEQREGGARVRGGRGAHAAALHRHVGDDPHPQDGLPGAPALPHVRREVSRFLWTDLKSHIEIILSAENCAWRQNRKKLCMCVARNSSLKKMVKVPCWISMSAA